MIPAERRKKMLEYIVESGSATITELGNIFEISDMTVHRDLKNLESTGSIQKSYGGVIASGYKIETDYEKRAAMNSDEKVKIGQAAASIINDGDSFIIDASTTTNALLPFLDQKDLTIFCTSVSAVSALSNKTHYEVHATGGLVYKSTSSFVGPSSVYFLDSIHVDKCFLGASGITGENITDPISLINELKRHIINSSNEVILCIDRTKFGRLSQFEIFPLEKIDLIITDLESDSPYVEELSDIGIEFLFVEK